MIAEMYKRRENLGYVFLGFMILVFAGWPLFQPPETTGEWLEMLVFLLPLGLIFSIIFTSRSHYNKVKGLDIPNSKQLLPDLNHVVIKKDAGLIPRLLLFEKDGKFIGMMKPLHVSWWMLPFGMFNESLFRLFPFTYGFISHDSTTQFTFRKTGWLKQVTLTILDRENREIGTYIQEELKALFRITGRLLDEKQEEIMTIQASGFSGDFRWKIKKEINGLIFITAGFLTNTPAFSEVHIMILSSCRINYPIRIKSGFLR
ncbi:hypothetical protein [Salibacterium aidingense]|uniref:hypothetical protein n=1 Tax=Salibacterium aidingense TaxID=384933 RepID=UPI0004224166|nr:hypothetical protein [Salibacterium aidingense]